MVKIILDEEENKTVIKGTDVEVLAGLSTLVDVTAEVLGTSPLALLGMLTEAAEHVTNKVESNAQLDLAVILAILNNL